jgi:GT2 family glycosyltransferase
VETETTPVQTIHYEGLRICRDLNLQFGAFCAPPSASGRGIVLGLNIAISPADKHVWERNVDLSIVIPTYNRNENVFECVLALAHNNAEIIVIDDGSPVPVEAMAHARVLRHESKKGRAAAVNTGLKAAAFDLVLIVDDDIFASTDMVARLVDEYSVHKHDPELALVGRVVWDTDLPRTLTMRWLEEIGPFRDMSSPRSEPLLTLSTQNTLLWRPFLLDHGGFEESFTLDALQDVELGLRLKHHGLTVRLAGQAVGYHHKSMRIRDLIPRELNEGRSAAYLHSKFPEYLPQVEDVESLLRNEKQDKQAEAAVEELSLLEQSDCEALPSGACELFAGVYRHYFLRGILEGLREIGGGKPARLGTNTLAIYNQAARLEEIEELDEARRLFRLVLDRNDEEYWAGAAYRLGCIEERLGNSAAAHRHLIHCLRINPEYAKAKTALAGL